MRYIQILLILGFTNFCGQGIHFNTPKNFPDRLQKKINKQIRKSFDIKDYELAFVDPLPEEYTKDKFFIFTSELDTLGFGIIELCSSCKVGGCEAFEAYDPDAEYESFFFSTLYDSNGIIKNVKVLEYNSQYGYEITAKSWLKQFIGRKPGSLKIGKDVDGISGATISVKSIISSLNNQSKLLE